MNEMIFSLSLSDSHLLNTLTRQGRVDLGRGTYSDCSILTVVYILSIGVTLD